MTLLEENINQIPSPCYVMEETLLRRNLSLISSVATRADVEIILAFKAFALWKSFPITPIHPHIQKKNLKILWDAPVTSRSIR